MFGYEEDRTSAVRWGLIVLAPKFDAGDGCNNSRDSRYFIAPHPDPQAACQSVPVASFRDNVFPVWHGFYHLGAGTGKLPGRLGLAVGHAVSSPLPRFLYRESALRLWHCTLRNESLCADADDAKVST